MGEVDGPRVVREERSLDGMGAHRGVGEVILGAAETERPDHRSAAAAKAWLTVARAQTDAGERDSAVESASRGLDELGESYLGSDDAGSGVEDDTTLKYLAAQDLREQGSEHAATALTRVLEERIALYEQGRSQHVTGDS